MKTSLRLPAALGCLGFTTLAACGGGGEEEATVILPPPPPPVADVQEGVFKDSNVAGLTFASGQESGTTGTDGRYTCETGTTVSFAVGAVELGSMDCVTLASPPALVGSGRVEDPAAINLAAFLLILDTDENADNGITISEELQMAALGWPQLDFAAADFSQELVIPLSDIMSIEGRMPFDLSTTPTLVEDHVVETLACAYSGTFVGQTTGDVETSVAITLSPDSFIRDAVSASWIAWDFENNIIRFTLAEVDIAVPPTFESDEFDLANPLTGTFDTPDTISGTWSLGGENLSGSYTATRLGGDSAATRMSGEFGTDDGGVGVLILDIDGNTVTGEAFEGFEGISYTITGSIEGDTMTLQAVGGGETINATGTIRERDRFGLPGEVNGTLDVGGFFNAFGCRLN